MAVIKQTFENTDLVDYAYTWEHNLNTTNIEVHWFDEQGNDRNSPDIVQILDANTALIKCNGDIAGVNYLIAVYDDSISLTGRKLFELALDPTPDTSMRLGIGKPNAASKNITLSSFLSWLTANLGFLKTTSNLTDLTNVAAAQSALQVYSKILVDGFLQTKATLLGTGYALGTTNTVSYTPAASYHPSTKKYTDDLHQGVASAAVDYSGKDFRLIDITFSSNANNKGMVVISGVFTVDGVIAAWAKLGKLPYIPTGRIYFGATITEPEIYETCVCYIDETTGEMFVLPGKDNKSYYFHCVYFKKA